MYIFWGKVRKGKARGKALGFPTANILLHKKIPEGVYASQVKVRNFWFNAVTFVGSAKTFNEKKYQAEPYILDFDQNIYNKWITVKLLKKIRDNKKFNSPKELITQMRKDEALAREFFRKQ